MSAVAGAGSQGEGTFGGVQWRGRPIADIHSQQGQVLTTWVPVLCPQSMLEQLLIHQPEDPIPFMIEHLHRDNDHGELTGGPSSSSSSSPSSSLSLSSKTPSHPLSYLCQSRVGREFDNLKWLIEKCLHFFWSTTNKNSLAKLLKCKPQNGLQNQLFMFPPALADVACWV